MGIGKICQGDVVTILESSSVQEAAKIMEEKQVGCLFVVKDKDESQQPVGVITDRDIVVKVVAKKTDLNGISVAEVMNKDLLILPGDQEINKSIEAMRAKGVRRAPVIDNGKVCGVATVDDLMIMLAEELNELASLVKQQASGRK